MQVYSIHVLCKLFSIIYIWAPLCLRMFIGCVELSPGQCHLFIQQPHEANVGASSTVKEKGLAQEALLAPEISTW